MDEVPPPYTAYEAKVIELLTAMLAELRRGKIKDDLWTLGDVAAYLSLSEETIRKRLVKKPGFPAIRKLPTTEDGGSNRWIGEQIRQWAKHQR